MKVHLYRMRIAGFSKLICADVPWEAKVLQPLKRDVILSSNFSLGSSRD